MYTLYGMTGSGNCYKPLLAMKQLGLPHRWQEVELLKGATRTPEFLARNPNGKVPVLELPDGRMLAESNAMLCYLAEGTPLLPSERFERALVLQWLFFEQYSHEPYIAVARSILRYQPPDSPRRAELLRRPLPTDAILALEFLEGLSGRRQPRARRVARFPCRNRAIRQRRGHHR